MTAGNVTNDVGARAGEIWKLFNPDVAMPESDLFTRLWQAQREDALDDAFGPYPSEEDLDECPYARPTPAAFLCEGRSNHGRLVWAWHAPPHVPGDNFRFASDGAVYSYDRSNFVFLDGAIARFMRPLADVRGHGG